MKICMVLAYCVNPFEGIVRPFINWGKILRRMKSTKVKFYLLNVGESIINALTKERIDFILFRNPHELVETINNERYYDLILVDDYIMNRLKILKKISNPYVKKAVYVMVLYGLHSISNVFSLSPLGIKEKMIYLTAKFVPFSIIKRGYYGMLKNYADIVIANSQITASLLYVLYGVEAHGVVYPPVDTETFKPQNVKKKNRALLYLGSHAGDTDENLLKKVCKILDNNGLKILVLGNRRLKERLSKEFKIYAIHEVSDQELAKIYSECKLVICPQKWEQFGYVIAESISCGTPVLAFNIMGPKEIIERTRFGFLANNEREFLMMLETILSKNYFDTVKREISKEVIKNYDFDIIKSTKHLLKILGKTI